MSNTVVSLSMNSKWRKVLKIAVSFVAIYFFVQYFFVYKLGYFGGVQKIRLSSSKILLFKPENVTGDPEKYLINTPICTIPRTKIMPDYYIQKWGSLQPLVKVPDCRKRQKFFSLVTTGDEQIAKFNKSVITTSSCGLWQIQRHPETDNDFKATHLGPINQTLVNVSLLEMFVVQCDDHYNYEALIPKKNMRPSVLGKMDYWRSHSQKISSNDQSLQPISVLIFGTDSTSRSHVYRSLPKSLKLMREMDFMDFQGYHSVYPATLENFDALLMGLTHAQMRAKCANSWTSPFDECPLIWKLFESHQYVTLFLEDGTGTFNWGGQSGFKRKQPTDYYPKPLFKIMMKNQEDTDCVSTETVPQFAFRYLRQFLETFNATPTFSLTWLNVPFHEDDGGLPSVDDDFENFLSHLKSSPDILDRTLILYLGDHGDRNHLAGSDSIEGYIERSLPPLFLRIPNILASKFPELKQNGEMNRKKLTSAFDLHHTFLHTLVLSGLENVKDFHPVLPDRSSLFSKIFDNRTCSTIHIDPGFCVCNATEDAKSLDNPYMGSRIHDFVMLQLNSIIRGSKYKNVCKLLPKPSDPQVSAKIIEEGDNYSNIIFNFDTFYQPTFEVQLKLVYDSSERSNISRIEMLSDFARTNRYGDQSWCVGFETDEDKRMKNFCVCKNEKPEEDKNVRTTTTTRTMTTQ